MYTDFHELINRFKDFPIVERRPSFLDIARFPHRETVWRNIFAFLLDPKECHGLKDLFLRSFFDSIGKPGQGTGDFDSVEVTTECQTPKGNYLDLLVRCNDFVIGIEMKVNAPLYNDLADYAQLVEAQHLPVSYNLVLSKNPCQTSSGFANLLYSDLLPALKRNMGAYVLNADPKYTAFLIDFLSHINDQIGGHAMDIDSKQIRFFQDNHETVKRLIDTHSKVRASLADRLVRIYETVNSQSIQGGAIEKGFPLFTWQGKQLIKFLIKSGEVRFYFQLGIADDYTNYSMCWIDSVEYRHLDGALDVAGFGTKRYALSQDDTAVAMAVSKDITDICAYFAKAQLQPQGI